MLRLIPQLHTEQPATVHSPGPGTKVPLTIVGGSRGICIKHE